MKKNLVLVAAAAMMAACSQNDVLFDQVQPSTKAESAIGFGTDFNSMTRAENSSATAYAGLENYHNTFRIWGYKNIEETTGTLTSVPVFDGTDEKSVATWTTSGVTAPFDATTGKDWVYSPIRYWDKSAYSYDFHAAAPAGAGWVATKTANSDMTVGKLTFKKTDATVGGESLPFNKTVTGKPNDAFATDVDLMIAEDVTVVSPYSQANKVNFKFIHILSRFNIGVKTTLVDPEEVILKSLEIFNMKSKGNFDESTEAANLSTGTAARWSNQSTPLTFGFPNGEVSDDPIELTDDVVLNDVTAVPADYKMVYQGLAIPQTIKYQGDLKLDGSNATASSEVYLKVVYTLNGEEYKSFYNLAGLFSNVEAAYEHPTYGPAYKTTDGNYAYMKDATTWYNSDGTVATTEPEWVDADDATTEIEYVPVKRKELADRGVCDITFCEGWQNNLWITITPDAILFDADVYEWATKENYEVTIQ